MRFSRCWDEMVSGVGPRRAERGELSTFSYQCSVGTRRHSDVATVAADTATATSSISLTWFQRVKAVRNCPGVGERHFFQLVAEAPGIGVINFVGLWVESDDQTHVAALGLRI